MIKSIFAESDNTIYEKTSSLNAGVDAVLELMKVSSSAGIFNSRIILKFDLDQVSSSMAEGDISKSLSTPKFYLNLYQTDSQEIPLEYKLVAYPISQSWSPGEGRKLDPVALNKFDNIGSSWTYRNKTSPTTADVPLNL